MIQNRIIKKTKDNVSALGLGAMRLPTKNGKIDKQKATQLVNHAIDEGINYIDTAYFYHNGESETFLKSIIEKRRDEIKISTKLPVMFVKKEEDLDKYLDEQLERLGVEYIDYYYLHALNMDLFKEIKDLNIFNFLDKIKSQGKVKHVGFSYHDNYDGFKEIIDSYNWDMCLLQYNFIDENSQAGKQGLEYAYSKDVAVFIMEPLKGGLLADNIPDVVLKKMNEENITDSPASWALKWILNQKEVTCVLSGMNTIEQLDENIKTTNNTRIGSISQNELEVYDKIREIYQDLIKIPCTNCGYCMDCVFGVDIPACFKAYNNKHIFNKNTNEYFQLVGFSDGDGHYASKCTNCGKCISKCPQHINIPEELNNVAKEMEIFGFKYLVSIVLGIGKPLYRLYLKYK